jgi:hypothetical protein
MQLIDKYGTLTVAQIRASKYDGQIAYIPKEGGDGGLSTLTATDVAAWGPLYSATPPMYLAVNYEDHAADWMSGGYAIGVQKALWIQSHLGTLGIANEPVVYLSADFHPTPGSGELQAILDCLRGAQSVLGAQARGVYGFIETLEAARAAGLADYYWLCGAQYDNNGNSVLTSRPWINLYQHNNDNDTVDGVTVDINDVLTADFGQWVPGQAAGGDMANSDEILAVAKNIEQIIGDMQNKVDDPNSGMWPVGFDTHARVQALSAKVDALTTAVQTVYDAVHAMPTGGASPAVVSPADKSAAVTALTTATGVLTDLTKALTVTA